MSSRKELEYSLITHSPNARHYIPESQVADFPSVKNFVTKTYPRQRGKGKGKGKGVGGNREFNI